MVALTNLVLVTNRIRRKQKTFALEIQGEDQFSLNLFFINVHQCKGIEARCGGLYIYFLCTLHVLFQDWTLCNSYPEMIDL